jgi:hypothetical protein
MNKPEMIKGGSMLKYALISESDIVSDNDSEIELLQHLEQDFDTDKYKDFFKGSRAVLVKIITIDDR